MVLVSIMRKDKYKYIYEPYLMSLGRHDGIEVIGPDEDVRNKAYDIGVGASFLVDYEHNPEPYEELYDKTMEHLGGEGVEADLMDVIGSAQRVVNRTMGFSFGANMYVRSRRIDSKVERTHNLSDYISNRAGVCIHQALAECAVLEMAKDRGVIDDSAVISLESSRRIDARNHKSGGGHAWVRVTPVGTEDPEPIISDPCSGTLGRLDETVANGRGAWNYLRISEEGDERYQDLAVQSLYRRIGLGALSRFF